MVAYRELKQRKKREKKNGRGGSGAGGRTLRRGARRIALLVQLPLELCTLPPPRPGPTSCLLPPDLLAAPVVHRADSTRSSRSRRLRRAALSSPRSKHRHLHVLRSHLASPPNAPKPAENRAKQTESTDRHLAAVLAGPQRAAERRAPRVRARVVEQGGFQLSLERERARNGGCLRSERERGRR